MELQGTPNSQNDIEKEEREVGEFKLLDFKNYYNAKATKKVLYGKKRDILTNTIESRVQK